MRALLLAVAVAAWVPAVSAARAQDLPSETERMRAQVSWSCADNSQSEQPTAYTLALHGKGDRSFAGTAGEAGVDATVAPTTSVYARIVIYVRQGEAWKPLVRRKAEGGAFAYFVMCANTGAVEDPGSYPALQIQLANAEDRQETIERLKERSLSGNLADLSFAIDAGQPVAAPFPPLPANGVLTYRDLLHAWFQRNQTAAFLDVYGAVALRTLDPPPTLNNLRIPARRAPETSSIDRARLPDVGGKRPKRKVRLQLTGEAAKSLDLSQPGSVDTYGYCAPAVAREQQPGTFSLTECATDLSLGLPIRIAGFDHVVVTLPADPSKSEPVRLNALLKIPTYRVPYPADWYNSASEPIEIEGGDLDTVLKRRVALRQMGFAACQATVSPGVADIIGRTLTFPPTPCQLQELIFPAAWAAAKPFVISGCLPGSATHAPVQLQGASIRCAVTAAELTAKKKNVKLGWGSSLEPLTFELPLSNPTQPITLTGEWLNTYVRVASTAAPPAGGGATAPTYTPDVVQYVAGSQACGQAAKVSGAELPTLESVACNALPTRIDVTYRLDRDRSDPQIAFDAFAPQVRQVFDLSSSNNKFDIAKARLKLPIRFSAERRQRYVSLYEKPADLVVKGVKVFADAACKTGAGGSAVALFEPKDEPKPDFTWPVFAQVLDNDSRPLTDCAASQVERSARGDPYLTFEFKSTRAIGARRIILISRSQELMNVQGLSRALDEGLQDLVRTAAEWHRKGALLSPIDVVVISQDGTLRTVFTGEDAALEPARAEDQMRNLDRSGPKTPELSLLRLQPELRNAERLTMVMDGALPRNSPEIKVIGSDLKGGANALVFLLSSDQCRYWKADYAQLLCDEIALKKQSERVTAFKDAFRSFLNKPPQTAQ